MDEKNFLNFLNQFNFNEIFQITIKNKMPFGFDYGTPETIGNDRLANAAAGVLHYADSLIIVDIGTAITFCVIADKVFKGGLIAPGPGISARILHEKTSKLPRVNFDPLYAQIPAKNTEQSIRAGLYFAMRGLIKDVLGELSEYFEIQTPGKKPVKILTGGISERLDFSEELFDIIDINLTLRGTYSLYEFQKS